MPLIPLSCPSCGANLTVDSAKDAAICEFCGKPYVVKDAIVQNYINNVININTESINIYTQKDFVIEGGVLRAYKGESTIVEIPNNVKKIADGTKGVENEKEGVFEGMLIESVHLPEGIENIGAYCFCNCESLKEIYLPSTLKTISVEAFFNCKSLVSIDIPDSVTNIAYNAFDGCDHLHTINCNKWFDAFEVPPFFKHQKEEREQKALIEKRKSTGVCVYCGGEFGFFSDCCKRCGRPKNY